MEALFVVVSIGLVIAIICFLAVWLTHLTMTKSETKISGWASHKKFISELNKYKWRYDSGWSGSLFHDDFSDNLIHASIYKFGGVGMKINNPISYIITVLYIKKYIKQNFAEEIMARKEERNKSKNYQW
jgi:hypothetical protein